MAQLLIVLHVLVGFALIGLILVQHGKGADVGAAFGSGASGTIFGARGSGNFLTRLTTGLAVAFFGISLLLAYLASHNVERASVLERIQAAPQVVVPDQAAADAPAIEGIEALPKQDLPAAPGPDPDLPAVPE